MLLPTDYQGNVHQRFARNHFETHVRQIYQFFKIATLFPKRDLQATPKKQGNRPCIVQSRMRKNDHVSFNPRTKMQESTST